MEEHISRPHSPHRRAQFSSMGYNRFGLLFFFFEVVLGLFFLARLSSPFVLVDSRDINVDCDHMFKTHSREYM